MKTLGHSVLRCRDLLLAGRLGAAGRARVHAEFNMQSRIAQLYAIIEKVTLREVPSL
jgi:hypothetical protein